MVTVFVTGTLTGIGILIEGDSGILIGTVRVTDTGRDSETRTDTETLTGPVG